MSIRYLPVLLLCLLGTACSSNVTAQKLDNQAADTDELTLQLDTIASGLSHPWSIAFPSEDEMLVTERAGRLRVIRDGGLLEAAVDNVPEVYAENQGGLFDIVLHPNFATNRLVYLSYARACDSGATTAVHRGRLVHTNAGYHLSGGRDILVARACTSGGRHFGGRMLFGEDGMLYLSIGDRGSRHEAQDAGNHFGSVLRMREDGSPAPGNPFAEGNGGDALVFTYGHRNIQGMARHPETGEIWTHEHGPRGGDEVNVLSAGKNYGWPEATLGEEYRGGEIGADSVEGMVDPLHHWTPSIAPSGLAFVTADGFAAWHGDMLVGALRGARIERLRWNARTVTTREQMLPGTIGRVRDIRQGADGALYALTDAPNGVVIRMVAKP